MIEAVNKSETSREDMILKHVNVDETKVCCEIGVLNGGFSEWIIGNLKPDILFLVDPWITYDNYDDANNSKQEEQDDRYSSVCEKFKDVNDVCVGINKPGLGHKFISKHSYTGLKAKMMMKLVKRPN